MQSLNTDSGVVKHDECVKSQLSSESFEDESHPPRFAIYGCSCEP